MFTVISYAVLFNVKYSFNTYFSLIPLTVGVMLAMSFDLSSLNSTGLFYALLSTFVFVSQNIFSKKLLPSENQSKHSSQKLDKLNLLFYSSFMAFICMIPLWFYSDFSQILSNILIRTNNDNKTKNLSLYIIFNGFVHFGQNLIAFAILSICSPVTYSIASLTKRIAVICLAIIYFHQSIHYIQGVGICLTGIGLYMYNQAKQEVNKGENKIRRDEALRDMMLPTTKSEEKFLSGKDSPNLNNTTYTSSTAFYPMNDQSSIEMPPIPTHLLNNQSQVKYRQEHSYPSPPTSIDSSPPKLSTHIEPFRQQQVV